MDNNIHKIIDAKLLGKDLSHNDRKELASWLKLDDNRLLFTELEKVWELTSNVEYKVNVDVNSEWEQFKKLRTKRKQQKTRTIYLGISSIAASIILILGLIFLMPNKTITYQYSKNNKHFTLPDGSQIWLNKNSSIEFSEDFGKENRNIKLIGNEAFFKVTKGNIPFVVNTPDGISAKVLGTSFNVKKGINNTINLQVLSGLVEFGNKEKNKLIKVAKGNEATYFKNTENIKINVCNNVNNVSWATGNFVFNNHSLGKIIPLLENYLSINIEIPQSVEQKSFSGKFNQPTIDEINVVISKVFDLESSYSNNKLTFTKK